VSATATATRAAPTGTPPTGTPSPTPCVGSVGGIVFQDLNGDGVMNPGEPPLRGATVTLKRWVGTSYVFVGSQVTVADGSYSFTGLFAAPYEVDEAPAPGFNPSPNSPHTWGVDMDSCADMTLDFGDVQ
jgi:hypothetical protein